MKISYTKKETKNLGNYENVSIEISIEDEIDFNLETQEEAFNRISSYVTKKLDEQFANNKIKANVIHKKPEDNSIFYDNLLREVRTDIINLIELSSDNRFMIKKLLNQHGASKIQDLDKETLELFRQELSKYSDNQI